LSTDGRTDVRSQCAEVKLGWADLCPRLVGETRLQPSIRVPPGINCLTVVQVVEQHRRRSGRPALVGHNGLHVAVGKFDLQLRERGKLLAVEGPRAAPAQSSAKPAIAQRDTKH
jgi:hypothetical protein